MKRSVPLRSLPAFALLTLLLASEGLARVTASDYARAERLLGWNASRLVLDHPVDPQWIEDGDAFWYRKRVAGGHEFMVVDPVSGNKAPAFDHAALAALLTDAHSGKSFTAFELPFSSIEFLDDGQSFRFWEPATPPSTEDGEAVQRLWTCRVADLECVGPEDIAPVPPHEIESPDGRWVAFVREENLWIRAQGGGEEIQLSEDGAEHYGYGVREEGCCYEISSRRAGIKAKPVLAWSPDSSKILTYRLDERDVEDIHLLETTEGRPVLHRYRYALPGDETIPTYKVWVFDIGSRSGVEMKTSDLPKVNSREGNEDLRWSEDGSSVWFPSGHRGGREITLWTADPTTGEARAVVQETSETFLDLLSYDGQGDWHVTADGEELIWASERSGWAHFYRIDVATGEVRNAITEGSWIATHILHSDSEWLYFTGLGREPGLYPYAAQLYRAKLDGSSIERLSSDDAHHDLAMSPQGGVIVDTRSLRDSAPVTVLRRPDGRPIATLEEADISGLVAAGWAPPQRFSVKARDGKTDLHGFLYAPPDLDPERSYPIIDYIYPGPQIGAVRWRGFTANPAGNVRALAQLGFFVVQFDATGTPFRSKAFHDVWFGDMADNGLIDHVQVIKQLAARTPQIDLDRVGIYGHSGGGFSSTGAILRFPDFFKVAVSSAGNHDQRSYFFGWGEKYQGPLETAEDGSDNYQSQANHLIAKNLKGKLLLTYGTLDDNVHPNGTLLLIDELIKHNKDFDMLALPNRNHRYANEPYSIRRTWDYFVEHLLGQTPPSGYKIEDPPRN
ncbi:MAG: DPP IV N-terminal domain-containing protein [Acidobacteriota bacterium]